MDISQLSKTFQIKRLKYEDIPMVLTLCLSNPTFYHYCPPWPTIESIKEDMQKLPPHTSLKDKFYVGFYKENHLIAVADLILNYPNPFTFFVGFFMVDYQFQNQGIGSCIIKEMEASLCKEYRFVRLGYVQGNKQSERFWKKQGFYPTGVIVKENHYSIVVLEKELRK